MFTPNAFCIDAGPIKDIVPGRQRVSDDRTMASNLALHHGQGASTFLHPEMAQSSSSEAETISEAQVSDVYTALAIYGAYHLRGQPLVH